MILFASIVLLFLIIYISSRDTFRADSWNPYATLTPQYPLPTFDGWRPHPLRSRYIGQNAVEVRRQLLSQYLPNNIIFVDPTVQDMQTIAAAGLRGSRKVAMVIVLGNEVRDVQICK